MNLLLYQRPHAPIPCYNARMSLFAEIETLKQKLFSERSKILDACASFTEAQLVERAAEEWSVQDILAHVANAEMLNVKFARLMLEQAHPNQVESVAADFPDYERPFELDRFNAYMLKKLRAQSFEQVMQTLMQTREETLAWLDTLTPEQLDRAGQHAAWGEQTVRDMVKILMLHDKMHAQQLKKLVNPKK